MKKILTTADAEKLFAIVKSMHTRDPDPATSAQAPVEDRGGSQLVGSDASGSLPVSSVLYLIERWGNNAAQWQSDVKYHKRPVFKDDPAAAISVASCEARASIYAVCIQDLRAEMARANVRQPEENIADQRTRRTDA